MESYLKRLKKKCTGGGGF